MPIDPIVLAHCDSIAEFPTADLSDYVMEPKLDGMRLQFVVDETGVRVLTRSGKPAKGKLPHIEMLLQHHYDEYGTDFILDGEAVYLDKNGAPDFNLTMRIMGSGAVKAVDKQLEHGSVSFMAFDLPYYGEDLRDKMLWFRRILLAAMCSYFNGDGIWIKVVEQLDPTQDNLEKIIDLYKEGAVLKNKDGTYGGRKAWLKYKVSLDADVVVMGYTPGTGKYEDLIGAVVFGQYKPYNEFGDRRLTERGQCSGMTDEQRADFAKHGDKYLGKVMVIGHMGFASPSNDAGFRHPQFKHFRDDKAPAQCLWDNQDGTRG
jgi:ATP-dependent DNA ligase